MEGAEGEGRSVGEEPLSQATFLADFSLFLNHEFDKLLKLILHPIYLYS